MEENIKEGVLKVLSEFSTKEDVVQAVNDHVAIVNLGLDSVKYINFLVGLEQIFDIEFAESALFYGHFEYIEDLVEYIKTRK